MLNEKLAKDMAKHRLIKADTINGWTYRLYGDKWIEATQENVDLIANSTQTSIYLNMPFTMADTKYSVQATPTYNFGIVTNYGFADKSGNKSKETTRIQFTANLTSVYSTGWNFSLEGYIAQLP